MHGFADEIFAKDWPQCSAAIAATGERRWARALQLDITAFAVAVHDFAKEKCAAITELRNEIAELMRGIGHGDRIRAPRNDVASEYCGQRLGFEFSCIEAQVFGKQLVELDQVRLGDRSWIQSNEKMLREARVAVGENSDRVFRNRGLFN